MNIYRYLLKHLVNKCIFIDHLHLCLLGVTIYKFKAEALSPYTNAKFTQHDFSPDFHSPTGFVKSQMNAQNRRQISARSH